MRVPILCALLLAGGIARGASAQNIVANPGFETGAFLPAWTQWGNTANSGVTGFAVPHSGLSMAFFDPNVIPGGIFQALGATTGTTYSLSFWAHMTVVGTIPAGLNPLIVSWEGAPVITVFNSPSTINYQFFSVPVTATTASSELRFSFLTDLNQYWQLDDISVVATGGPAAVAPEPGATALLGTGLVMLFARVRRRSFR